MDENLESIDKQNIDKLETCHTSVWTPPLFFFFYFLRTVAGISLELRLNMSYYIICYS